MVLAKRILAMSTYQYRIFEGNLNGIGKENTGYEYLPAQDLWGQFEWYWQREYWLWILTSTGFLRAIWMVLAKRILAMNTYQHRIFEGNLNGIGKENTGYEYLPAQDLWGQFEWYWQREYWLWILTSTVSLKAIWMVLANRILAMNTYQHRIFEGNLIGIGKENIGYEYLPSTGSLKAIWMVLAKRILAMNTYQHRIFEGNLIGIGKENTGYEYLPAQDLWGQFEWYWQREYWLWILTSTGSLKAIWMVLAKRILAMNTYQYRIFEGNLIGIGKENTGYEYLPVQDLWRQLEWYWQREYWLWILTSTESLKATWLVLAKRILAMNTYQYRIFEGNLNGIGKESTGQIYHLSDRFWLVVSW